MFPLLGKFIRCCIFWIIHNIPLGKHAPYLLAIALGSKGKKINKKED